MKNGNAPSQTVSTVPSEIPKSLLDELPKLEELRRQEFENRAKKCSDEIQKILVRYNCQLGAIPELVPGSNGLFMLGASLRVMPLAKG